MFDLTRSLASVLRRAQEPRGKAKVVAIVVGQVVRAVPAAQVVAVAVRVEAVVAAAVRVAASEEAAVAAPAGAITSLLAFRC